MTPAAAAWSETCPSGLVSDCIHTTCSAGAELHCVDGLCTCNSPPRSKRYTASLHTILYTCIIQIYQGWCKNVKNINLILLNYLLVCQYVDILSIYTMCMFEKPAYIEYTIIALWSLVIVEKFFLGLLLCSFYGPKMATSAYINIWSLICWGVFKKKTNPKTSLFTCI